MEEKTKTRIVEHFDYKDTIKLKAHINPHARMMSRKRTGLNAHEQRSSIGYGSAG